MRSASSSGRRKVQSEVITVCCQDHELGVLLGTDCGADQVVSCVLGCTSSLISKVDALKRMSANNACNDFNKTLVAQPLLLTLRGQKSYFFQGSLSSSTTSAVTTCGSASLLAALGALTWPALVAAPIIS